MATLTPIARIERHARKIACGKHEAVQPGMPYRISEASSVGDGVWQGDLGIEIIAIDVADAVPSEYEFLAKPKDSDRQLVPGSTQGAKHCLDSLDGVKLYRPQNWSGESLVGPVLELEKERTIMHPTHGPVTIPAGFTVRCRYQREYDSEQRRVRRNAD